MDKKFLIFIYFILVQNFEKHTLTLRFFCSDSRKALEQDRIFLYVSDNSILNKVVMLKFIGTYAKIHIAQSLRMHWEPCSNISQLLIWGGIGTRRGRQLQGKCA
jgi:hypothetical protein